MDERLSMTQIVLLVAYAIAMAGGQILFKRAALRNPASSGLGERLLAWLTASSSPRQWCCTAR
jgi:hypothetical protein